MKTWILNKLARPLLPVLRQSHRVVVLLEIRLNDLKDALTKIGLPNDTTVFKTVADILGAVITVKAVIERIIVYLGGELPIEASSLEGMNLASEVEKLKRLL